jgi:hypothetical protein
MDHLLSRTHTRHVDVTGAPTFPLNASHTSKSSCKLRQMRRTITTSYIKGLHGDE